MISGNDLNTDNFKLCIYTICKDEIEHIERFLNKHKEADYICLLDTGSSDGTFELLQEKIKEETFKDKLIISQKRISQETFDFAYARNESMKLIPKEVTLCICIDIDEYLSDNWYPYLRDFYYKNKEYLTYSCMIHNLSTGASFLKTFCYKNIPSFFWKYCIHEVCLLKNFYEDYTLCKNISSISIVHTPNKDSTKNQQKQEFYRNLVERRFLENTDDTQSILYLAREFINTRAFDKFYAILRLLPEDFYYKWDFLRECNYLFNGLISEDIFLLNIKNIAQKLRLF